MGAPWFAPDAEAIFQRDAAEWKKRALAAEAKLSGYRRLREIGEEVLRAVCERDAGAKARAIDAMAEELASLDIVDAPRDPYLQTHLDGNRLEVRLKAGLGCCSKLDPEKGIIEVESLQPDEGKAIGLFFQVLQLSDIAVSLRNGEPQKMDENYLHAFVVPFLALCVELGLLAPSFETITADSIGAHLVTIDRLTAKDAASGKE